MTALEAASEGIIVRKEQFDPQAGIDWYNQLIRDFNVKDAQLTAKDVKISALIAQRDSARGLLRSARSVIILGQTLLRDDGFGQGTCARIAKELSQ